jgi:predicted porin
MNDLNMAARAPGSESFGSHILARMGAVLLVSSLLGAAGLAQAQTWTAPQDQGLTWHGITISGAIDLGLQYQPNAAPVSDYYAAGGYNLVQADSLRSITAVTPNNLSQSNITLSGIEPLFGTVSGIFRLQTLFQPNSANLTDGLKSLVLNNGKAAAAQNNGQDSDAAGQAFAGAAYAGLSDPTFGSLTFGWQTTLLSDGVIKYDPNAGSYAFSLIGQSGTARGGGDTEDKRLKNSLKYSVQYSGVHFGAMYQFSDNSCGPTGLPCKNTANTAYQFQLGGEYAGVSLDAFYSKIYDAISAASLSAAQVADLQTAGNAAFGYSLSNSLSATISDNTAYALLASYTFGPAKIFAAYERVQFDNPQTPLAAGTVDVGGYILAFVTNNKYATQKNQNIYWAGVKYAVLPDLDATVAFYRYQAGSYLAGAAGTTKATAACLGEDLGDNVNGNCSGTESAGSLDAVYHFTKRFDGYAGAMYSTVSAGLAAGFKNTYTVNPTLGFRFRF